MEPELRRSSQTAIVMSSLTSSCAVPLGTGKRDYRGAAPQDLHGSPQQLSHPLVLAHVGSTNSVLDFVPNRGCLFLDIVGLTILPFRLTTTGAPS